MLIIVAFIIVFVTPPLAALLITWGIDYFTIGFGLNPWIAFPLAFVCLINFYVYGKLLITDFRTFCLDTENAAMREYIRLCEHTTTKL